MTNVLLGQTKTKSMFPIAHGHCILATNFAHSFFFFFPNDVCIKKSLKWKRKTQVRSKKKKGEKKKKKKKKKAT